jgi:hypothetical protein
MTVSLSEERQMAGADFFPVRTRFMNPLRIAKFCPSVPKSP